MTVTDLQRTIASLFKRKSKKVIPAQELELLASMELRWFEPKDARKLVELSIKLGLIEETADGLSTKFDVDSVEIPFAFKPPKDLLVDLEHNQDSLFMQLIDHICISTALDRNEVIAEINAKQVELNNYLTLEVVAVLFAKEKSVDVEEYISKVKDDLLSSE